MNRKHHALHHLRQLLRSWLGVHANSRQSVHTLDACLLEDRILYSATIMPVEGNEPQLDVETQFDLVDQLVSQELDSGPFLESTLVADSPENSVLDSAGLETYLSSSSDAQLHSVPLGGSDTVLANFELLREGASLSDLASAHYYDPLIGSQLADASVPDTSLLAEPTEFDLSSTAETLIQYRSEGHVLGFGQNTILVASMHHSLQIEFVGANMVNPSVDSLLAQDAQSHPAAALSDTLSDNFTIATYSDVWDGVTAVFEAQEGAIFKSTYYVDAGLDASAVEQIRLQYNRSLSLDEQGNLRIAYNHGYMTDSAPIAWQDIDGRRIYVDVQYVLLGDNQVGFAVGQYDVNYQLVIDPTLTWNMFLGGSGTDIAFGVAVDSSGNIFVTGSSTATWGNPLRAFSASTDAFVAKLDSSGNLLWNTFLGAGGTDVARAISIDGSGNLYIGGDSTTTWGNPVRAFSGGTDGFVAKLDTNGSLIWHSFVGGSGTDQGRGIAVDSSGFVYLIGDGTASWGAPVRAYEGGTDTYAAKLDSNGTLVWNTFLGASGIDSGRSIAVDHNFNVYLAGSSTVTWGDPIRAFTASVWDAYAAKLDSNGVMLWNTFLGGSGIDNINSVAVDSSGSVYLAGTSTATWGSPIVAFDAGTDGFAMKLGDNGEFLWHTFIGGSGTDNIRSIAVESSGNVYLSGDSNISWGDPLWAKSVGTDAQVVKLNNSGSRLWNTFLGGAGTDIGYAVAIDASSHAYLAGASTAAWGSPNRTYASGMDGFIVKLSVNEAPVLLDTPLGLTVQQNAAVPMGNVGLPISAFTGGLTDSDSNAAKGIAITASVESYGTWYYSIDNGATWAALGPVSPSSSLLLADDAVTRLYFVPTANFSGSVSSALTIRGWDQASGTAGTKVNTVMNGGTTAFSSQTDVIDLIVTPVNQAPNALPDMGTASEAGGYSNSSPGSQAIGNVLSNDHDPDAGDTLSVTGVVAGVVSLASGNVGSIVSGSYGSILIAANGSFSYTVDNNNVTVQALRSLSETLIDTFTYTIVDTSGLTSTAQILVAIHGANDINQETTSSSNDPVLPPSIPEFASITPSPNEADGNANSPEGSAAGPGSNPIGDMTIRPRLVSDDSILNSSSSHDDRELGLREPTNRFFTNFTPATADIELLLSTRLVVDSQILYANNEREISTQRLVTLGLEELESLQLLDQDHSENLFREMSLIGKAIIVTAVGTGLAIWILFVGQVITAVLRRSRNWLEFDPLIVIQGDTSEDETELSAEDVLFDTAKGRPRGPTQGKFAKSKLLAVNDQP